ncbi:hypothetical protein QTP70_012522 [Hemibagrus guttatus]|uniref:Uncharacterized protein n=1 Tax=Hemibagrus guttatus TaxID=175788 RepID=A0AAE0PR51_9TELE|nr:hypothetical protein QTP70_012522 [Hemibagrus guttatus]
MEGEEKRKERTGVEEKLELEQQREKINTAPSWEKCGEHAWPPPYNQDHSTPATTASTGIYPLLSCPREVDFVIVSGQVTGVLKETGPEDSNKTSHPRDNNQVVRPKQQSRGGEVRKQQQELQWEDELLRKSGVYWEDQQRWLTPPQSTSYQPSHSTPCELGQRGRNPRALSDPENTTEFLKEAKQTLQVLTAEPKGGKSANSSCPQSKGDKQGIPKAAEEQGATAAAAYSETREEDKCSRHREGSKKWVQITGEVQLTPLHGDKDNEEHRQDKQSKELMDMTLAALERVEELKKHADSMGQRLQTIELCHEDRMREFTKMQEAQSTAMQSELQLRNKQTKMSQKAAQMERRLEARTSIINRHRGVKYIYRESGVTTRSRTRTKYVKVSEARRRDDELEDEWVEEPEDSHDPEGEDKQKGGDVPPPKQCPLIIKGGDTAYIPWTFMDVTGLIGRLPSICDGTQKWITRFEEQTTGQHLALGDIKAILFQTLGKAKMTKILDQADLKKTADDPHYDHHPLGPWRTAI